MDKNLIDVSYASGFIAGRLSFDDESSGTMQTVAGLHWRCRASKVLAYHNDAPGVLVIVVEGMEQDAFSVIGSIEGMDKAMKRAAMHNAEGRTA